MTESTISGNSAVGAGGVTIGSNHVTVKNSTISNNSATGDGGGVLIDNSRPFFVSSIIANNTGSSGPDCFTVAGDFPPDVLISEGFNLIQDTSGCVIKGVTAGNIYGMDPMLGPLQDNGGPTFTQALLPGSPAIDAVTVPSRCRGTDQRGVTRTTPCDIGAYESQ